MTGDNVDLMRLSLIDRIHLFQTYLFSFLNSLIQSMLVLTTDYSILEKYS